MFEIIPNWHPIFVHFTVALLSLAATLFVANPFVNAPVKAQWQTTARWCLWFGTAITILTGLSGLYAYNTVAHDTPSHEAMTKHRNWAIVTIVMFLILAAWSIVWIKKNRELGIAFVVLMVISGAILASTAWHGGEVVYRYGLGVMSLPKPEGEGHSHSHNGGDGHSQGVGGHGDNHHDDKGDMEMDFSGMDEMLNDDGHEHEH